MTLHHSVQDYRAGDLEARYPKLQIEEDFFVNYGFLPRTTQARMHPRAPRQAWPDARHQQAAAVLAFVRERGVVHPRNMDMQFAHGKSRNWFGGSTNVSTQLLDGMYCRGLLRIARREGGVRLYAARPDDVPHAYPEAAIDTLVDVVVHMYAPLPERSLGELVSRLGVGAPHRPLAQTPGPARLAPGRPAACAAPAFHLGADGQGCHAACSGRPVSPGNRASGSAPAIGRHPAQFDQKAPGFRVRLMKPGVAPSIRVEEAMAGARVHHGAGAHTHGL